LDAGGADVEARRRDARLEMQELRDAHEIPGGSEEQARLSLSVCSICLSAVHGSQWIGSSELIRSLRTFEHDVVPRLGPALCDRCSESIRVRRQRVGGVASST
jgi:hypothetical protein